MTAMGKAKETLKLAIGRVAEVAFPSLGREIDELRAPGHAPRLKRAILYSRLRRANAHGDTAAVERALAAFWRGGPGEQFHAQFNDERFKVFRETHSGAIDALAGLIRESGDRFSRLVEIGCGDGKVLADCAARLAVIDHAVGIDINGAVIDRAAAEYVDDPRLSFTNAEAREWLTAHPQPGTVLLSNGGVLEYFSPENLDRLLAVLAAAAPAAVVLIEPAAPDHDLANDPESHVFGREYSFSHNYRSRLAKAGFEVALEEETRAFGARLMLIVGVLRTPSARGG